MQNTQILVDQFKILDISLQKEKVVIMLGKIQETSPSFANLLIYINNTPLVSTEFLTMTYDTILQTAESISQTNHQSFIAKMENYRSKMHYIHEKEIQEKLNADNILEGV